MKVFSVKRAALSCVLGFLIPFGYGVLLAGTFYYAREATPRFLIWPIGWPLPPMIFLLGPRVREDVVTGVTLLAACNTLLYGALAYAALPLLLTGGRKPEGYEPPPPPERPDSGAE